MIRISKQIHGTEMTTVWFANEEIRDKGIIVYKESKNSFPGSEPFETLISDLTQSKEDITAKFAKNCKYKIKRAIRENVKIELPDSVGTSNETINEFLDFFDRFWKSKGVDTLDVDALREEMCAYRDIGALTIAKAVIDSETVVYHTHIFDDKCARLLHSASLFRLNDEEDSGKKNLIGMANRLLHQEEMFYFKDKGIAQYDWGGAGHNEEVASITDFKESFGGDYVTYYDGKIENGIKAKLIVTASQMKQRNS